MEEQYSKTAKFFHWSVALLILALLALGLFMQQMEYSDQKMQLYRIHKSFGVIVLGLMGGRVLWRFIGTYPKSLGTHKIWEKILSKIVHIILYLMAFSMPLTGWAMSSSYGYPVSVFGWFQLPALVAKNEVRGEALAALHQMGGYALIALIVLHVVGALKHHVIDKDTTLKRMLPFRR